MKNCCDSNKHKDPAGHVHFADGVETHNCIQVKPDGGNKVQVHVGFLQTNHKYEIQFVIPNLLGKNVSASQKMPTNVELTVIHVKPTDSTNANLHVLIHLSLAKEGLIRECFSLEDEDKKELSVIIHARILGKHSGTPMVKDGIHCLEVLKDSESVSDNLFT